MADNTEPKSGDEMEQMQADAAENEAAFDGSAGDGEEASLDGIEAQGEGFADPVAFLSAELDKLEAEKTELKDQSLRLVADMENLRRRTVKDVHDARAFSIAGFARDMLEVSDNLRRALDAVPSEAREAGDNGLNSLIEGVEMTERAMLNSLEKHGVKKISPKGEKFDPNLHQAMFEVPNPDVANNTIVEVVQDGFVIGERCLRPAMVGIAKGGPKQAASNDDENGDGEPKASGDAN